MPEITLVCSAHRENGLCNAAQLLKLLQRLTPDVLFEETSLAGRDAAWSLEAKAIARYREYRTLHRVPVDRYVVPAKLLAALRAETDRVFDCVEQTSEEYLSLKDENDRNVHMYGFQYLNSPAFAAMAARLSEIEETTISRTCDQRLIRGLEEWRRVTQSREHNMVRNIYDYCRENVFRTAVLLVGAAHKPGIIREIARHAGPEARRIAWKFAYDGEIADGAI